MGKVIVDLSVSLDGYVSGPNDGPKNPLGDGGMALFKWMEIGPEANRVSKYIAAPDASQPVIDDWMANNGAIIFGRRTFEIANGWNDETPFDVAAIFVVTHDAPTEGEWNPKLSFVTDGVKRALELAKEAAGDKNVSIGGASVGHQLMALGLVDQVQLSIAPVVLGGGVPFFEADSLIQLEQERVVVSDGVTHIRYNILR